MSGNRADSEDILQETFVTVYLHRGELKNPMGIEKWIRKILVRKAVKLLKRKKRESSLEALLEDEETASKERLLEDLQGVSPQERAIQGEQQRQMMKLIAGLPVKLRTVVILYYYEDCSIREIADYYDVPAEDILVIYDDFDLELGTLRIRKKGSAGSHNGMKSVIDELGTKDFPRIRIGIGSSRGKDWKDFVIGKASKDDMQVLSDAASRAADAAACILEKGIDRAMNEYNVKAETTEKEKSDAKGNDQYNGGI